MVLIPWNPCIKPRSLRMRPQPWQGRGHELLGKQGPVHRRRGDRASTSRPGLAVHPGARTPREPGRLSSPSSFRIPAAAAAGPPARPRHVGLPAARPQPQGAQGASSARSRRSGSARPMSRCSTACRRRRAGTVDMALGKTSTAEEGWRMVPDAARQGGGDPLAGGGGARRARGGRVHARRPAAPTRSGSMPPSGIGIPIAGDPVYGAGKGPMLLHALSLASSAAPSRRSRRRAPLPPTFVNAGFGDVALRSPRTRWRNVPGRVRAGRAERQQGRDRLPAALRRLQARPRARRLSAAEDRWPAAG